MSNEGRKASDLLLDMEAKMEAVLHIVRSQDLNIKILSNKLNSVLQKLDQAPVQQSPQFSAEAVDTNKIPTANIFGEQEFTERQVPVSAESKIPVEDKPQGFRRTSRPETYAGDGAYLPEKKTKLVETKPAEVVVPAKTQPDQKKYMVDDQPERKTPAAGAIPVQQRTVDRNGKSIFLADIEITNYSTGDFVYKTRTNGAGKWMASLVPGVYKVFLKKKENLTKEKLEAMQTIEVDGTTSPLELPMIIVK